MVTIRVSENIYRELNRLAGELRQESGHPVSMDDVLEHLLKTRGLKLSDFAGSWKMSDAEAKDLMNDLKRFWSHWKYPRNTPKNTPIQQLVLSPKLRAACRFHR